MWLAFNIHIKGLTWAKHFCNIVIIHQKGIIFHPGANQPV